MGSSARRRSVLVSALCLAFVAACGRSVHHGDDDDTAGVSGAAETGGSSQGGTSASGGSSRGGTSSGAPSTGGTVNGGAPGSGGTAANGGTGNESSHPDLPPLRRMSHFVGDPDSNIVYLRGISFGNDVWSEPTVPLTTHHTEEDFARLDDWGANAVRFYLNYQLFEDDSAPGVYKQAGFDDLDQNISWAQEHGVYLIFNMHVPQGGFQSNGDGDALWTDPSNQDRLVALWRAIADHCKGVGAVAGFDLLNEPRPTTSKNEWVSLAGRIVGAIREVDPDHMLVVERTNSVGDDWSTDADMNLFLVPDDNVLYEFHFYEPFEYTTQWAEWIPLGEGGKYPDPSIISSGNLSWYDWNYEPKPPPYAPPGDSDWQLYTSDFYTISDPAVAVLGIALVSELNAGTVWFDDIFIDDEDPATGAITRVYAQDLESLDGWYFWKAGTTGSAAVSSEAHSGKASLMISGTDHDANLGGTYRRAVVAGHSYSVGGYMKGAGISNDSRPDPRGDWTQVSRALIRLDYYSASGPLQTRGKEALAASLDRYVAFGERNNVPLFIGEFGLIHYCFENDRGGTNWVTDMLDLMHARSLNFTYHVYHEPNFGIFHSNASKLPDLADANQPLIDVLSSKLRSF